ncbi:MAG: FAD-dependent oxidoreductase [Actinomycetota bacterium]|nr:FAD-dependent oxidoreductase [Actinomycetota bacterium]
MTARTSSLPGQRRPPDRAVVVGAGMVGLSTAWFLQESGVEVTVVERDGVGAGSSWGNAGWLSPGLAVPLPDPAVLRYGVGALVDPASALYVPLSVDPPLWSFLARFAYHCTARQWRRGMAGYLGVNRQALDAFDTLESGGVEARTVVAPILASFAKESESAGLRGELALLSEAGQQVDFEVLSGHQARAEVPVLSERVGAAVRLDGQRYIDPGAFVDSLAKAVAKRGGTIRTGFEARSLHRGAGGFSVSGYGHEPVRGDVVVLASGAWLADLAKPFGVRTQVRAGRGYSFSVQVSDPVDRPLYFPLPRVACTPYRGGLRVGGTMELCDAGSPLDMRRVESLIAAARPFLSGVDWDSVTDTWVGSRPITPDGLPLVGRTADPDVFVAGGHGMWGVTLGPVTGRLLARQIVSGEVPTALVPFDPLR